MYNVQEATPKRRTVLQKSGTALWLSRSCGALLLWTLGGGTGVARAADFLKPTAEELAMTSVPKYPGVPAAILFKEEITRDDLHSVQRYNRIKILTEDGKKYANVELGYVSSSGSSWEAGDGKTVDGIIGRTIHPDGTIIPFTGKPYLKVVAKAGGYKVQEKIFTLPDVTVGSIIEYRYETRINDNYYESPTWLIQDELFVKAAHFAWWPTTNQLVDEEQKAINSIAWFPILPPGAKIEKHEIPGGWKTGGSPTQVFELSVQDVPPTETEEYMPPISSFSYRVQFSFTPYRTPQEFWTNEGRQWSKRINNYATPNGDLTKQAQEIVSGAKTPEEKLRALYAEVMKFENTEFTRERDSREDKAAGLRTVSNADDIFKARRGSPTELTELFIAMARAVGFPSYAMYVPDRSETLFTPQWQSLRQLSALVAIVNVDGKEHFFDPGSRFCPFGQLAWQHDFVSGLRQTQDGTALSQTVGAPYKQNHTTRVANLTMNAQGEVTGKVDLSFWGSAALYWREVSLRGDADSLRKDLRETAEQLLPKTLEIEVVDIKDVTDYEKPLVVSYKVKGTLGNAMGKRMMLPADLFLANQAATFPHETRDVAVYFHYPQFMQDAVRINFPQELVLEGAPASATYTVPKVASYTINIAPGAGNITTRRDFSFGNIFVLSKDYPDVRSFYTQLEAKDQENLVLKVASQNKDQASAPAVH